MPERRYSDEEVLEIIARASEKEHDSRTRLPPAEGMTLAELQKIGSEAGIAPALIAQAARSLDIAPAPAPPVFLGLPLGAARTVRLERRMTDAEWEQLVVTLRETFNARGVIRIEGSFRSWSNGNLQCLVEPDGDGQRVRFRTVRGNARPMMYTGLGMMGVGAAGWISSMLTNAGGDLGAMLTIGFTGAALFIASALPLPRWAKLRQRQMDELAERLTAETP
jgi:hypothetical protein